MSDLLQPELLRKLEQIQLLTARRAKSALRGERRSRARGLSVVIFTLLLLKARR